MEPFCRFPWHSITIGPHGAVQNCCATGNILGFVNEFNQALEAHKNIKQDFLHNKEIPGCEFCYNNPNPYAKSINTFLTKDDFNAALTRDFFRLRYLDIRWKNTCTLACVYCSSDFSSTWAQEDKIKDIPVIGTNAVDTNKGIKEWVMPQLETVKRVYLAGGEPLLIKDNVWLLEKLLESNPDCNIMVSTNASNLGGPVFELLKKFPEVIWLPSAENVNERFEYVRYGAKWENFVKNIRILKDLVDNKPRSQIVFQSVFHALCVDDIFNFLDFLKSEGFSLSNNVGINYVTENRYRDFDPGYVLSAEYLEHVKQNIKEYCSRNPDVTTQFNVIIDNIDRQQNERGKDLTLLIKQLAELDKNRNLNSKQLWPELYGTTN